MAISAGGSRCCWVARVYGAAYFPCLPAGVQLPERQETVPRPDTGLPPAVQVLQVELAVLLAHGLALTLQVLRAVACTRLLQLLQTAVGKPTMC